MLTQMQSTDHPSGGGAASAVRCTPQRQVTPEFLPSPEVPIGDSVAGHKHEHDHYLGESLHMTLDAERITRNRKTSHRHTPTTAPSARRASACHVCNCISEVRLKIPITSHLTFHYGWFTGGFCKNKGGSISIVSYARTPSVTNPSCRIIGAPAPHLNAHHLPGHSPRIWIDPPALRKS